MSVAHSRFFTISKTARILHHTWINVVFFWLELCIRWRSRSSAVPRLSSFTSHRHTSDEACKHILYKLTGHMCASTGTGAYFFHGNVTSDCCNWCSVFQLHPLSSVMGCRETKQLLRDSKINTRKAPHYVISKQYFLLK